MKLKSLFLLGLASVASLLSSCVKEADVNAPKFAAQIKASEDGIRHDIIPVEGGELVVELLAAEAWSATVEPGTSLDKVDDITIEPASGSASSSIVEVVAKLPANKGYNRSVKVSFIGSTHSATVSFIQNGELGKLLSKCTVSEFLKKPVDASVYYQITGLVGTIADDVYSNFNIVDPETAESILIYGLAYKSDITNQEVSVLKTEGVQEGDMITIASTRGDYKGTPEGINSYYISHEKSQSPMIKLGLNEFTAVVGQSFELPVTSNLVTWTLSSDVQWLSFNPASGSESTTVVVSVSDAGEGDTATITLSAEGLESVTCAVTRTNVQDATAAEINAAEDGKVFRVTGIVSKIENTKYGSLYIKDYTGEVFVYGTNDFAEENIAEGDVITVVGPKSSHNESPQLKNVDVEKHYSIKDTKVADFRAAEDNNEVYYRLTGKVIKSTEENTKFDLEVYGNFALEDESGSVYVYGVVPAWGAAKKQFGTLGVKEGDTITIIAYKTTYNGLEQAGGAVYISHEAGQTPEPSFSVDGKQWVFEWQYDEETKTTAVLDFGVYAEGQFTFAYDWGALDPESYAGISPLYQGTYVVDAENSKVTLSFVNIFDEEDVLSGDITYSELTETTAHFEFAGDFVLLGLESADATVGTPEITDDPSIGGGEDEYYTLEEVADLGVGTGYQVKDVVVLASCNNRTIIADNTAFMFLFNKTFEVGDVLTVSGDIVEYDGVLEWSNATVEVTSKGAEVPYHEVKAYGAEDFAQYVTSPVVEYVKFTAVHDGSKLWVGDTQIYLQNPTGLTPQAGEVEITGFTLGFNTDHNNVTVLVTSLEQKNYLSSINVASSVSVNVGESVVLGASSTSPAALSYVSADETIATVSAEGVVSGVKEGTTTITISVPAEGLYSAASAEVSITVNASGTVEPKVLYTLDTTEESLQGSDNSYTGNYDIELGGITWNVTGNTQMHPWRIGGKNIDAVDREVYTKTAFPNALTSVDVTFGTSSITVNSCKLVYSTNADFSESSEIPVKFTASSTVSFVADFPANAYYKLVLNVTNATKNNKFVQLSKIEFIGK